MKETKLPGDIMTVINSESLIWMWEKEPIRLGDLSTKRLKHLKFILPRQSKKGNLFWNGVHYIGYIRAVDAILEKRKVTVTIPTNPIGDAKIISKSAQETADRFLGELDVTFPKSRLVKSISNQVRNNKSNRQINYNHS